MASRHLMCCCAPYLYCSQEQILSVFSPLADCILSVSVWVMASLLASGSLWEGVERLQYQIYNDIIIKVLEQAGAELCQAQFKLGLAKTALMMLMLMLFFAFPVLKI